MASTPFYYNTVKQGEQSMNAKSSSYHWVGLDVGKKEFSAAIDFSVDDQKLNIRALPCKKFNHTEKGVVAFLKWVDKMTQGYPFKVVMETTGHYSINLCKLLQAKKKGLECSIVNPYLISNYLKSLNLPQKTDDIDAQGIARFGMERHPEATILPSKEEEELLELSRHRDALVKAKVAFESRGETRFSKSVQDLNKDFLKTIKEHIARTDKLMTKLAWEIPWVRRQMELMMSVPGVAETTAVGLSAELGDFKQYTRKEISAASGLSPLLRESGTSVKSSKISKRAPGRIRQLLFLSTNHAIKKMPQLHIMYTRLLAKGKTKLQVKCACMRVFIQILRSIVVYERPYSEELSYQSAGKATALP